MLRSNRVTCRSLLWASLLLGATIGCQTELERRFQTHIEYLASDELAGRGVGTPEIELAADYIAREFESIGLLPIGDNGSYLQSFEMTTKKELSDKSRLAFQGAATSSMLALRTDFMPLGFSSNEEFTGPLVFAGYGIVADDRQHNDFIHLDVNDKVVLMFRGEPPSWEGGDEQFTSNATFRNKIYNAKDRGADAVLIVNQKPQNGEADRLIAHNVSQPDQYGLPSFHVARHIVESLVAAGGLTSLEQLQKQMDKGEYVSKQLEGVTAKGWAGFKQHRAPVSNVVGLLKGEGPLADEHVVIGAHYDHLGVRTPSARRFKDGKLIDEAREPEIHNGADDNASGTSGLIESARMLADGKPLRRSVLFVAFTAEESGLHGSKFYVDSPPRPLDGAVAMLNMDMIGRLRSGSRKLQVFGVGTGEGLEQIVTEVSRKHGLAIAPVNDPGGRSDHAPFVRQEIPAVHFFSGQHPDYHKPSDDSDKIDQRGGAKTIQVVADIARRIANRADRMAYQKVETPSAAPGGTPSYRVVMGLAPGYGEDGKPGMPVEAVNPDGPADLAGMKAGDRIVRISDKPVANIYDYMAATRSNEPGDEVVVVVLRDGKERVLHVKLAGAG